MNTKSYVSLEQHLCLVCGSTFKTGDILVDRRMRPSMEMYTTTGWGLCAEHQKLSDDGFLALVECDPQRSDKGPNGTLSNNGAFRTGRLAHIKREKCASVFNQPVTADDAFVFVEPASSSTLCPSSVVMRTDGPTNLSATALQSRTKI